MTQETFEKLLYEAAKKYADSDKVGKKPETQFKAGAMWLWELLKGAKDVPYYEEVLRRELIDRIGSVEMWQESLITDTAALMVERDEVEADIQRTGRIWEKYDKNMNLYYEANSLINLKKETVRSIGMQREHLGLSFKVNPNRMKDSPKNMVDEDDPMRAFYEARTKK